MISRFQQSEPWTVKIDRTVLSEIRIKQRRGIRGFVSARPLVCFPSIDVWIAITGSSFVLSVLSAAVFAPLGLGDLERTLSVGSGIPWSCSSAATEIESLSLLHQQNLRF